MFNQAFIGLKFGNGKCLAGRSGNDTSGLVPFARKHGHESERTLVLHNILPNLLLAYAKSTWFHDKGVNSEKNICQKYKFNKNTMPHSWTSSHLKMKD